MPTPQDSVVRHFQTRNMPTQEELHILRGVFEFELQELTDMQRLLMFYDTIADDPPMRAWRRAFITHLLMDQYARILEAGYSKNHVLGTLFFTYTFRFSLRMRTLCFARMFNHIHVGHRISII